MFSGFFLARLPEMEEGQYSVKVAVFEAGTDFRKVLEVKTDNLMNYDYGALVHFSVIRCSEADVENKPSVRFMDLSQSFSTHETSFTENIIHTIHDFDVEPQNLTSNRIFHHADLGIMEDPKSCIYPGHHRFMTFEVIVEDDTFRIIIHHGEQEVKTTKSAEVFDFASRVENIPEILKIEYQHIKNEDSAIWGAIGRLKLVKFNDKDLFSGIRPVLELCDKTKFNLFEKQSEVAPIAMIKLIEEDGEWKDDPNFDPQLGTIFPTGKNKPKCVVKLKGESRHKFERLFEIGNVFRFESDQPMNHIRFWERQTQKKNPLYRYTIEEKPESMKLNDVIESHKTDPAILKLTKDARSLSRGLNQIQIQAMQMALNESRKLVCIQGPPGTGKTLVLSHLIAHLIVMKKQIVVFTPTREALKNIKGMTEAVLKTKKLKLHEHALIDVNSFNDYLSNTEEAKEGLEKVHQLREMHKNGEIDEETLDRERDLVIKLLKNSKTNEVMQNVRVVFATIASSFVDTALKCETFKPCLCIIDEAGQVMESQTWPAVMKMKRIVMAGDPKQLPALVLTDEARLFGLHQSVMDRIISKKEHYSWVMLESQYRCHQLIAAWSNDCFYSKKLETCVGDKTLHRILDPKPKLYANLYDPLVLVDTSLETDFAKRQETYEQCVPTSSPSMSKKSGSTYANEAEAKLAMEHYRRLVEMGVQPEAIAIITPYKGQMDRIRELMDQFKVERSFPQCGETTIGTVDSVQGQEYDVVIFSMVRSNPRKNMGFVTDLRRLNVVITRAKLHFLFIGNGFMLANQTTPEIRKLFDIISQSRRRFHPNNVYHEPGSITGLVTNNYGKDLSDFISYTKDEEMKKWCLKFVEQGKDPVFRQLQNEKRFKRQIEHDTIKLQELKLMSES